MPIRKTVKAAIPAAKPAVATNPKVKAAAAPAAAAAQPQSRYNVGDIAVFTKYKDGTEAGMFEAGEKVYLHSSQQVDHPSIKNRKVTVFIAVKEADAEAAKALSLEQLGADDSAIAAEEVSAGVLRVYVPPKEAEIYHPKAIGAMVQYVKAGGLTDRVKTLLEAEKQSQFYIGGTLAFIRYENPEEIANLGYEDTEVEGKTVPAWQAYLETEFNISVRTADAYVSIYRRFSELPNFNPAVIADAKEGIGWSKAALIANYLTDTEKADEIIALAKETPIRDLRTVMVEKYTDAQGRAPGGANRVTGGAGRSAAQVKTWTFRLAEASATGVSKVFELAAKQLGMPIDSPNLFETIVLQWGQQNLTPANAKQLAAVKKVAPATAGISRAAPRAAAPAAAAPAA